MPYSHTVSGQKWQLQRKKNNKSSLLVLKLNGKQVLQVNEATEGALNFMQKMIYKALLQEVDTNDLYLERQMWMQASK